MTEHDLSYLHPQLRPLAVKVADLTPDPRNARKRDRRAIDALKASISARGFRSAIIVQKNAAGELIIRAGNGRHQAMTELGHEFIPALVYEEGDEDAIAFAIADNRTAELAEWDFEALNEHLNALESSIDLDQLGWTEQERQSLTIFALDGASEMPSKTSVGEEIDPDNLPDYEPEQDSYLIKVENVPPMVKEAVVDVVNKALKEAGYDELEARAY